MLSTITQSGRINFRDAVQVVSKAVESYFNDRINNHYVRVFAH